MQDSSATRFKQGILLALGTYSFWGLFPIYFKLLADVPAIEVLMHRIIWSFAFTLILITALKLWQPLMAVLKQPRLMLWLSFGAVLLGVNWLLFIYGIATDDILQLSLGYFLNPIFNILFGFVFFGEKINRRVQLAMCLVIFGLLFRLADLSAFPFLGVVVAIVFSLYGVVRKFLKVDAVVGLSVESGMLVLPAIIYLVVSPSVISVNLMLSSVSWCVLLMLAGPLTSMPLLTFTLAVRRIPYYLVGFCQYITPTLLFFLAVYVYIEPWSARDVFTFAFVWAGIALCLVDTYIGLRKKSYT